jgi:hypothetical protein
MFRFAVFILALIVVACFWPVTRGDFVIDDYIFIAQSRMVKAPWEALWLNHFFEPVYFRPIGIATWWLATRWFEFDYALHSVINVTLHLGNVLLVSLLARRIAMRNMPAVAAAICFALLPFTFSAILWPSNRFDLLATFFSLLLAGCTFRYVDAPTRAQLFAIAACTLLACWSKEFAYPTVGMIAIVFLCMSTVELRTRLVVFATISAMCVGAFAWRFWVLPIPVLSVGHTSPEKLLAGAQAWGKIVGVLAERSMAGGGTVRVAWWALIVASAVAFVLAIMNRRRVADPRFGNRPLSPSDRFFHKLASLLLVFAAAAAVQLPLMLIFAPMIDDGIIGSITYARFYYAPAAALAIAFALLLACAKFSRVLSIAIGLAVCVIATQQRDVAIGFAKWTNAEIRPMAQSATRIADEVSSLKNVSDNAPCVLVFLGTQTNHTWFRMFADVSVKSLTRKPDTTWRCHVMTEGAPWIFISPADTPLPEIGLPKIVQDAQGTAKPDFTWGGVRYHYRNIAPDLSKLPHARFFEWKSPQFVEVTDDVHSGARVVKSISW